MSVDLGDGALTPKRLVRLSAPHGSYPYWRLEWRDSEGNRQQTSGTRNAEQAWRKALQVEQDLVDGATPKTSKRASEMIAYWLDPTRPRPRKRPWGESHARSMADCARWYLTPTFGKVRCQDLKRSHLQRAIDAAPNADQGERVRKALVSLLRAGRQGEWLMSTQVVDVSDLYWHGQQPEAELHEVGEDARHVDPSQIPSHTQVEALAKAAGKVGREVWWRELMVYLAAYSGVRQAELWALTVDDVDVEARIVRVRRQVVEVKGKGRSLTGPKMAKTRKTIFRAVTPTGYQLQDELARRVTEATAERDAGNNPLGLLFPGRDGVWLRSGNFHRDVFERAAIAAGWSSIMEQRPNGPGKTKAVRVWDHTWHSLRHVFCTTALDDWRLPVSTVSMLAGHADVVTTMRLYIGQADDAIDRALTATA